jgi:hypothetical protein
MSETIKMTAKELGDQPVTAMWHIEDCVQHSGLTKREWFAGLAMQGLLSNSDYASTTSGCASDAWNQADAMLEHQATLINSEPPKDL